MDMNKLNKTLNEAATNEDRCNWLDEDGKDLITKINTVINKYKSISVNWDEEKQQNFCDRIREIMETAEVNLGNVIVRMRDKNQTKDEVSTTEPKQAIKTEEEKVLKEILDLGFINTTGPKQEKDNILMLLGTKSGRGYRLQKFDMWRAYVLNNYGQGTNGQYRYAKDDFQGSKLDCLNWILANAKEHLKRMENRNSADPNTDRRKYINRI